MLYQHFPLPIQANRYSFGSVTATHSGLLNILDKTQNKGAREHAMQKPT